MVSDQNTAEKIMDVAQEMVQKRGYHAFSYRDISERIGIKTASIHYYYPSKPDLAKALLARVRSMFEDALNDIDLSSDSSKEKLEKFSGIFLETYGTEGRLCPFCMIATNQETIADTVQEEVRGFWIQGEIWLRNVLDEGVQRGEFTLIIPSLQMARIIVSSLEGAMVVAKAFDDRSRLEDTTRFLIKILEEKTKLF